MEKVVIEFILKDWPIILMVLVGLCSTGCAIFKEVYSQGFSKGRLSTRGYSINCSEFFQSKEFFFISEGVQDEGIFCFRKVVFEENKIIYSSIYRVNILKFDDSDKKTVKFCSKTNFSLTFEPDLIYHFIDRSNADSSVKIFLEIPSLILPVETSLKNPSKSLDIKEIKN